MVQANEQALKVVIAAGLDFAALHAHTVDEEQTPGHQVVQVEAQRGHVLRQVGSGFLEGHEDRSMPLAQKKKVAQW